MAKSPMMQQYHQAKEACGDAILLFRMGDFYELFFDDAKTASRLLGLTLTSREKGENPIPMAGFPHHQLDQYLAKIIAAGHKAAVCDQVEDAKKATGLVRREITRIVSRGTLTDDALLDASENNFLVAIVGDNPVGVAWVDVSTGRFEACSPPPDRLDALLSKLEPAELVIPESDFVKSERDDETTPKHKCLRQFPNAIITRRPEWAFSLDAARSALSKLYGVRTLEGLGFEVTRENEDAHAIRAAGAILDYLSETQKASLTHLDSLAPHRFGESLDIDPATRRSLELTRTLRDGQREGSLLGVMDRTITAMGARLLASWLASPLTNRTAIDQRLDAVAELVSAQTVSSEVRESLRAVYDVERLLARIVTGRATPRDLGQVATTLSILPKVKAKLTGRKSDRLNDLENSIELLPDVRGRLESALVDMCPLSSRDGGVFREGYNAEVDRLRDLTAGGKKWIAKYQAEEMERTGIPNIKVGFNKVFGYYLEVSHAHADKTPDNYIRKQTIKAAERYITPTLKAHEEDVIAAEESAKELEHQLFVELREFVASEGARLMATAKAIAELDALLSLAELARERNYCRPTIVDSPVLAIQAGRHPVLDLTEPDGAFVPNDTRLDASSSSPNTSSKTEKKRGDSDHRRIAIITGPNMAGKSTYIRQVALITILAQMGSFVPAESATVGIADRVFSRVGASDELTRGQSTFMVEMVETARILNTATARSLVILDEIGRGTSTYDGISLAWSIVEHLHDKIGCRTLFATHYHELTDLAKSLSGVCNLNVAVREWNDDVIFLHQIVPGTADKSYGIHVARLAGVPSSVNERAKDILVELESEHLGADGRLRIARDDGEKSGELQLTLFGGPDHPIIDRIRTLTIEEMTPVEALRLLADWRNELAEATRSRPR